MKAWKCSGCGHKIGEVKRYPNKLHQLTIRDSDGVTLAVISGSAKVYCQLCAKERRWVPGKTQMNKLVQAVKAGRS